MAAAADPPGGPNFVLLGMCLAPSGMLCSCMCMRPACGARAVNNTAWRGQGASVTRITSHSAGRSVSLKRARASWRSASQRGRGSCCSWLPPPLLLLLLAAAAGRCCRCLSSLGLVHELLLHLGDLLLHRQQVRRSSQDEGPCQARYSRAAVPASSGSQHLPAPTPFPSRCGSHQVPPPKTPPTQPHCTQPHQPHHPPPPTRSLWRP